MSTFVVARYPVLRMVTIPRTVADLDEPGIEAETMQRLETARVIFADYERLRADFPPLRDECMRATLPELDALSYAAREERSRGIIDAWLLEHAAIVSMSQIRQTRVNTPIRTRAGDRRPAFRPPAYGRAAIVEAHAPVAHARARGGGPCEHACGLLDVKGVGVRPGVEPEPRLHGNGLIGLDLVLVEVVKQRLIERVLEHARSGLATVPTYAVLDAGFDVKGKRGRADVLALPRPAGILVRRAHRRDRGGTVAPARGSVAQAVSVEIEMLLRAYGIASTRPCTGLQRGEAGELVPTIWDKPIEGLDAALLRWLEAHLGSAPAIGFDGINIQTTREICAEPLWAELVDFGHYEVRSTFEVGVLSTVADRELRWGGLLDPRHPAFPQPDPRKAISPSRWNADGTALMDEMGALAARWRCGEIDGDAIHRALHDRVVAATAHWSADAMAARSVPPSADLRPTGGHIATSRRDDLVVELEALVRAAEGLRHSLLRFVDAAEGRAAATRVSDVLRSAARGIAKALDVSGPEPSATQRLVCLRSRAMASERFRRIVSQWESASAVGMPEHADQLAAWRRIQVGPSAPDGDWHLLARGFTQLADAMGHHVESEYRRRWEASAAAVAELDRTTDVLGTKWRPTSAQASESLRPDPAIDAARLAAHALLASDDIPAPPTDAALCRSVAAAKQSSIVSDWILSACWALRGPGPRAGGRWSAGPTATQRARALEQLADRRAELRRALVAAAPAPEASLRPRCDEARVGP